MAAMCEAVFVLVIGKRSRPPAISLHPEIRDNFWNTRGGFRSPGTSEGVFECGHSDDARSCDLRLIAELTRGMRCRKRLQQTSTAWMDQSLPCPRVQDQDWPLVIFPVCEVRGSFAR